MSAQFFPMISPMTGTLIQDARLRRTMRLLAIRRKLTNREDAYLGVKKATDVSPVRREQDGKPLGEAQPCVPAASSETDAPHASPTL